MCQEEKKISLQELKSVQLVAKLPVVETTYSYASNAYIKVKNLNRLLSWGLGSVEGGLALLVDKTLAEVPMARKSLSLVDRILFKSLEQIEQRIPAVTYPPELLLNMTKDYLSVSVVRPVVKRADCVKKSGLSEASRYRELAASKLDTALDAADRYIDRYLPEPPADINNQPETDRNEKKGESKTAHALEHANRLSKKLKRRLTNRTIAEAKALRQHGIDTINTLLYLADLMVRDPRLFAEKMRQVWANLSDDEPENQLPPANLDQLVAMFVREAARRMVHLTNFSFHFVSRLPTYSATVIQFSADLLVLGPYCAANLFGYLIKAINLDGAKAFTVTTVHTQVTKLNVSVMELQKLFVHLLDYILSHENVCKMGHLEPISPAAKGASGGHKNAEVEHKTQSEHSPVDTHDDSSSTSESTSNGDTPKHD